MNAKVLNHQISSIIESINILFQKELISPSLILTYSLIDILSWLDRPIEKADVDRNDFYHWVNTYIRPETTLNCTAFDLYGARCSMIHSFNSESKLSRNFEAREIFYCWGKKEKKNLENEIELSDKKGRVIVLKIEDLNNTLFSAVNEYLEIVRKQEVVLERAEKFFRVIRDL